MHPETILKYMLHMHKDEGDLISFDIEFFCLLGPNYSSINDFKVQYELSRTRRYKVKDFVLQNYRDVPNESVLFVLICNSNC